MQLEIQVYDGTEAGKGEHFRQQVKGEFVSLIKDLQEVDRAGVAKLENNIRDTIDFLDGKGPFIGTGVCFFLLGQVAGKAYKQGKTDLADRCHQMINTFNCIYEETKRAGLARPPR